MKISVKQLVKDILKGLPERHLNVLNLRYGLSFADTATLAEIGEKYGITRERVRQLENLAMEQTRENSEKTAFPQFMNMVVSHLKTVGGVAKENQLVKQILAMTGESAAPQMRGEPRPIEVGREGGEVAKNSIRFLLEVSGKVFENRADDEFHTFWHLGGDHKEKAASFIDGLHRNFQEKKAAGVLPKNSVQANFVSISRKFSVSPFGEFGLSDWAHIVPRTARDWSYLVLKREKKPLHFTKIAEKISGLRDKKANPQTIHNELIKDANFVLVGKGAYGLSEYGYEPGTAREIIAKIIRGQGPMRSREIVSRVSKQRLFKENTILINLQNKKHFQRLNDGRYDIREA